MISTGCTMEHSFKFPHREEDVSTVLITYKCEDKIIIDKTLKDCLFKEGRIYVSVTQEEALEFPDNTLVKIQIRSTLKNGATIKSDVINEYSDELLDRRVI